MERQHRLDHLFQRVNREVDRELAAAAGFDLPDLVARGAWLVARRAFGEADCELDTIVVGRDGRVLARRRS